MKLSQLQVEYAVGKVAMVEANVLVQDVLDMEALEYWESRLLGMGQPFVVAYREEKGKIYYSIFADLRKKGSPFR